MPKKEKMTPEALKRIEKSSKDREFVERAKKAVKKQ